MQHRIDLEPLLNLTQQHLDERDLAQFQEPKSSDRLSVSLVDPGCLE